MEHNNLINKEFKLINENKAFVSILIISSKGSAPRTAGTKMIVTENGKTIGTIGGGTAEAAAIEKAKEIFNTKKSVIIDFNLTVENIGTMDMICGGGIKVLISFIEPTKVNKKIFGACAKLYEEREKYLFISDITDLTRVKQGVVYSEGFQGDFLSEPLSEEIRRLNPASTKSININNKTLIIEPAETVYTLFIFGAGHVSRRLAKLTSAIGFYTVVIDDRKEFANKNRFKTADKLITVADFKNSFDQLKIDNRSFIVIITRGHLHDKTVLSKALKTKAAYIGMIGSKKKKQTIYNSLLKEGFSEEQLKTVYSPIGLPINAETPEEIAVSITAELIKVRAEHKKV